MANHASHGSLPYPIKNARYSLLVPYVDADGDPTAPTTPDTEISKDAGTAADCAEEAASITGMDGMALLTLTGAEMDCSMAALNAKAASGPKATLASIYPRVLPVVTSGTLTAGSSSGGTLQTAVPYSLVGCFIRTTGGSGGGGTGGANNQARKIMTHTISSGAFTVEPNFETAVSSSTTYDVLAPEGIPVGAIQTIVPGMILDATQSITWQQAMKGTFHALAGVTTIVGTTYTIKTPDGTGTRITFTLDANKQRTAVTLNL